MDLSYWKLYFDILESHIFTKHLRKLFNLNSFWVISSNPIQAKSSLELLIIFCKLFPVCINCIYVFPKIIFSNKFDLFWTAPLFLQSTPFLFLCIKTILKFLYLLQINRHSWSTLASLSRVLCLSACYL